MLLLCARTRHTPEEQDRICRLLGGPVDWPRLVHYATTHGLGMLLHRQLSTSWRDQTPQEVLRNLQAYVSGVAAWNLSRTRELLRVLGLLEAEGIAVIPFKGPMLAAFVYGDIALRTFLDLDLLVPRDRFYEVKAVLVGAGYQPYRTLSGRAEAAFLKTQMGYEFIRQDPRVVIEVHWAFLNRVHAFNLEPERVWRRSTIHAFAGTRVRRLSLEDLLLYLCAHGTRSFWERAVWICDVAELVRGETQLDWPYILDQASRLHGERILFSGLRLARDLFEVGLSDCVQARLDEDAAVVRLTADFKNRLFRTDETPLTFYEQVRVHLMMRERFLDRLPYYRHLAKLVAHSLWRRVSGQRRE